MDASVPGHRRGVDAVRRELVVAWVVHTFARLVLPDAATGTRRWWYARTVPVYVCLGGVGFTISHGQVNVLVVTLVAGMFAANVAGRTTRSGMWLAAAITLKVIPGVLLLYPNYTKRIADDSWAGTWIGRRVCRRSGARFGR